MTSEADGNHPDWWELTDFGTNSVDLTGYSWNDDSHGGFAGATNTSSFTGVIIHPGESVIFTEPSAAITNTTSFRDWWGISNTVQVVMLLATDPGLGASGDTVRIWSTNILAMGSNTNGLDLDQNPDFLVDKVDTLGSPKGKSLIYNPTNGLFGITNSIGTNGAFQASTTTDVGSPGFADTNPAPVVIVSQPADALVNIGGTAVFQVTAYGLPRPRFQWLLNGAPWDVSSNASIVFRVTNNFSRTILTITNVQVTDGGTFRAVATNGFQSVASSNAVLTVNTSPFAPIFTKTPATYISAYPGQTVTLQVAAFGNPPPTFLWQVNSNTINGQNDSQLQIFVTDTNQTGAYTVIATNSAGGTNISAFVLVTPKPDLRITEIMSTEGTNEAGSSLGHNDWWELSNFGSSSVNLQGYRFDDDSFSFSAALTITNNITIAPGESIVFVEDMSPDEFRTWWGANNLPPTLQIIRYHGSGISFSGTAGDALTLWNGAATSLGDFIDSVSIASNPYGISFSYDPYNQYFLGITPDGLSVAGVNGAFASTVLGDIGSPGTIVNFPRFTGTTSTAGGFALSWVAQPNWNYTVQYKTNLTDATWQTLTNFTSGNTNLVNIVDPTADPHRFYRVMLGLTP